MSWWFKRDRRYFLEDIRDILKGFQADIKDVLEDLEEDLEQEVKQAASISLALPSFIKEGIYMANLALANDVVATITILTLDAEGKTMAHITGDVFSVVSNNHASLEATMGVDSSGNPAVVIRALVDNSPGVSFTVSDTAGLTSFTQVVDISGIVVPVPKATSIGLDMASMVTVSQPVPTLVGP